MARVSSRYNHRLSKNQKVTKTKGSKEFLRPDQIVIRKKNKIKNKDVTSKIKTVKAGEKKRRNVSILNKVSRPTSIEGGISLKDLKDYCCNKKIILVGNAKDIVKKSYGSKIDSYDIVIRMNHGHPLSKYVVQMGKKYNIWAHGFLSHKRQIKEYNSIKKVIDFHIETNEKKFCKRIFDEKAFLIPRKWYKNEYELKYPGKEMSTGLNAATFFIKWIQTMSEIAIVGFDFLKTTNPVLHSASARRFHDTDIEKSEMFSLLLDSGKYVPFNSKYNFVK